MEHRTINKDKREQTFLKIKENKNCILTPWEASGFHGVRIMDL